MKTAVPREVPSRPQVRFLTSSKNQERAAFLTFERRIVEACSQPFLRHWNCLFVEQLRKLGFYDTMS